MILNFKFIFAQLIIYIRLIGPYIRLNLFWNFNSSPNIDIFV